MNNPALDLGAVQQDTVFKFSDGNLNLVAKNTRVFCVHRFKLECFSNIKSEMCEKDTLHLEVDPDDMHNTFKIIYSPPYLCTAPEFDTDTLVSALRVATLYGNPTLRTFAANMISHRRLPPIQYVSFAREFNIPAWEEWAIEELAARAQPISRAEAQVLGLDTLAELAARRESELSMKLQPHDVISISSSSLSERSLSPLDLKKTISCQVDLDEETFPDTNGSTAASSTSSPQKLRRGKRRAVKKAIDYATCLPVKRRK